MDAQVQETAMTVSKVYLPAWLYAARFMATVALALSAIMICSPIVMYSFLIPVLIPVTIMLMLWIYLPLFKWTAGIEHGASRDTIWISCGWIMMGVLHIIPCQIMITNALHEYRSGTLLAKELVLQTLVAAIPGILGVMMIVGAWIAMANRQAYRLWRQRRQAAMRR